MEVEPLRRRALALADAVAAATAVVAFAAFGGTLDAVAWGLAAVPGWLLVAKLYGLYDRDHRSLRHLTTDELPALLAWSLTATSATAILLHATPAVELQVDTAAGAWLTAAASAFILRSAARGIWRRVTPPERTLIVGTGPLAEATRRKFELFPDIHVRVVAELHELSIPPDEEEAAWLAGIDRVVLASQAVDEALLVQLLRICRSRRVKLSLVPPARGMFGTAVQLSHIAELPVIEYNMWDASRSSLLLKRALDLSVSAAGLVALAPLFCLVGLAIRLDSRGPVLFAQRRAGLGGKPFRMYKFRTMQLDAPQRLGELVLLDALSEPVFKLSRDPRVTSVGRLLRRTSIDELPQLLNVLRGDMSLVGPRPEQVEVVERYAPEHRFRLAAKPGMTGPMQVYGRAQLSFEERLAVEREYLENISFSRDLRILSLTIPAVLRGGGAY